MSKYTMELDRADAVVQRIRQARALAYVMDTEDFESFSHKIKADYRWALWTLLDEADEIMNPHLKQSSNG